jgi:trehalose 2-sulfotransferase
VIRVPLVDVRNGPDFDLPACDREPRTYVIATTPRTGSTLLCRALWDTGRVGAPKEYLNPTQLRDWAARAGDRRLQVAAIPLRGPLVSLLTFAPWTDGALRAHLDRVRSARSGPTGWFGLKLHYHHKVRWFGERPIQALLGPVCWIRLRREDRLGQAISWVRARQTWRWTSDAPRWAPEMYDGGAIRRALDDIDRAERGWDRAIGDQRALSLVYERIVDDLDGAAQAVLAHLGEPASHGTTAPALRRQADAISDLWRERFLRERDR